MFDKNAWQREHRKKNRERYLERERLYYAKRKSRPGYDDYQRDNILRHRYGISLEQKREMYEAQSGLCKLCRERLPEDFRKAHVDHNHETDEVRGLVHWSCNRLIGFVESNLDLIESVYVHLKLKGEN